jgi:hypothetical protein
MEVVQTPGKVELADSGHLIPRVGVCEFEDKVLDRLDAGPSRVIVQSAMEMTMRSSRRSRQRTGDLHTFRS